MKHIKPIDVHFSFGAHLYHLQGHLPVFQIRAVPWNFSWGASFMAHNTAIIFTLI